VYEIALSVAACLRAGTRVDVAWIVDPNGISVDDRSAALAITPGGGRIGSLLSGALDGQLAEFAARRSASGRLVDLQVSAVDAAIAGLSAGGTVRCAVVPATELPGDLWPTLVARRPVCLVGRLDGDVVTSVSMVTDDTADPDDAEVTGMLAREVSDVRVVGDRLITVLRPTTKLVIAGDGPVADALRDTAALLGWHAVLAPDPDTAVGMAASLSALDGIVVMGHDVEPVGRILAAALAGDVGYIGALGSRAMQQTRADWLAYRGITDLERIHGPAGLDLGARTPAEIALAVVAQALAVRNARDR